MESSRILSTLITVLFILFSIFIILIFGFVFLNSLSALDDINNSNQIEEVPIKHGNIYVTEIYRDYKNGGMFYVIVDSITGIQYIFMDYGYSGGLSPRYNIDGSLYVMNKSYTTPGGTENDIRTP